MAGQIILVVFSVLLFIGMVFFMDRRNKKKKFYQKFLKGVDRGLQDYRQGKVELWSDVKEKVEGRWDKRLSA